MAKKSNHHTEERYILVDDLCRHPRCQRKSPVKKFIAKYGPYDANKDRGFHQVVADGDGGFFEFDGATRTEAFKSKKGYDPGKLMRCLVFGNGKVPTDKEIAEWFLNENADRNPVGGDVQFDMAVIAERPDAIQTDLLIKRFHHPFKGKTGLWKLVKLHGPQFMGRSVDEALAIWGKKDETPLFIVRAIAAILSAPGGAAVLKKRRSVLKKQPPAKWRIDAQIAQLRQVGVREDLHDLLVKKLIGRGNI